MYRYLAGCFDLISCRHYLEAEKCLFILTSDLAPYLFGQRVEDNKTSHLLYVALTRSLNSLSILVTKEVEKKYNREVIKKYLE